MPAPGKAAKQLDVDLTEDEVRETVAEAVQAQKEATEAAAGALQQMGDEDLEAVAGGAGGKRRCIPGFIFI